MKPPLSCPLYYVQDTSMLTLLTGLCIRHINAITLEIEKKKEVFITLLQRHIDETCNTMTI